MSWLLVKGGGQPWLICIYVAIVSLISTVSVALMKEGSKRDISRDLVGDSNVISVSAGEVRA
jgi:hypothetical protein